MAGAKKGNGKHKEFVIELIKFFKSSICGVGESVATLTKIQKEFPEEYKIILSTKLDPQNIDKIMEYMTDEEKEVFMFIFFKATIISQRLNKLFELTLDEKKTLADEITKFGEYTEKSLTRIAEERLK